MCRVQPPRQDLDPFGSFGNFRLDAAAAKRRSTTSSRQYLRLFRDGPSPTIDRVLLYRCQEPVLPGKEPAWRAVDSDRLSREVREDAAGAP